VVKRQLSVEISKSEADKAKRIELIKKEIESTQQQQQKLKEKEKALKKAEKRVRS